MNTFNQADFKQNLWDKHVVPRIIPIACGQGQIMKRRSLIVPHAIGKVLELGVGGGLNLSFYDASRVTSVSGVDPSPGLLNRARDAAKTAGIDFDIKAGIAESLPFSDNHFDTVVVTFTLCSVQDVKATLSEARRVLKPDGRLLFLEHGKSPDSSVSKWQNRIEPIWKPLAGGCHLTRPVIGSLVANGYKIVEEKCEYVPKAPKFAAWVEYGHAVLA